MSGDMDFCGYEVKKIVTPAHGRKSSSTEKASSFQAVWSGAGTASPLANRGDDPQGVGCSKVLFAYAAIFESRSDDILVEIMPDFSSEPRSGGIFKQINVTAMRFSGFHCLFNATKISSLRDSKMAAYANRAFVHPMPKRVVKIGRNRKSHVENS